MVYLVFMEPVLASTTAYSLSDPAVWQAAVITFAFLVVASATYIIFTSRERENRHLAALIQERDYAIAKQIETEQAGHIGSFLWDFKNPAASFWSQEMYELFGLTPRRRPPAINDILPYIHEGDRAQATEDWQKAHVTSGNFSFLFRVVTPKGLVRYLRITGRTIKDMAGHALSIQGIAHDISKEMEVDKAKTEFVSLASHQLKTPLTAIRWTAESLLSQKMGPLTPKQLEYVQNIAGASARMADMINELLNVSRLELGTLALTLSQFDLKKLIASVVDEQRSAAEKREVLLDIYVDDSIPLVTADENLLRMIFQNLLSNAIKYTLVKTTVSMRVEMGGARKEAIYLRVTDHGIGIPEDDKNVFQKLHRADNAQKQVPEGTGLGLYLVKTILERVGGAITFASKPGVETVFTASFPVVWKDGEKKTPTS